MVHAVRIDDMDPDASEAGGVVRSGRRSRRRRQIHAIPRGDRRWCDERVPCGGAFTASDEVRADPRLRKTVKFPDTAYPASTSGLPSLL